ncbi:MAG: DUF4230 domain-containing protein, partial [Caldilineaceae bacterium]|nr:DUF4230 domain-containing protein [Caldilineaceae bacterium]
MTNQPFDQSYTLQSSAEKRPAKRPVTRSPERAPLATGEQRTQREGQRSALESILRFLGFSMAGAALLVAVITLGGAWLARDTVRSLVGGSLFPTSTETTVVSGQAIVDSIRRANKQILVEHYNVVDIDYSEAPAGWLGLLPIQQNFVLLLKGRVPAGFDLEMMKSDDIWISADGRRVQLVLPPPVIFTENIALDLENSRLLGEGDSCPDFICRDQLTAIQADLLPQGRRLLAEA